MLSYVPPEIPGWDFRTNSGAQSMDDAIAEYYDLMFRIASRQGWRSLPVRRVRAEQFEPDRDIRWAVYTQDVRPNITST